MNTLKILNYITHDWNDKVRMHSPNYLIHLNEVYGDLKNHHTLITEKAYLLEIVTLETNKVLFQRVFTFSPIKEFTEEELEYGKEMVRKNFLCDITAMGIDGAFRNLKEGKLVGRIISSEIKRLQ